MNSDLSNVKTKESDETQMNTNDNKSETQSKEENSQKSYNRHEFELHVNGVPQYYNEGVLREELREKGLTRFKRIHKPPGWSYAFISFEV